ncbi:hypothetical protein ACIQU5_27965 [Streptomyces sp. NPDC090306]|uniref:hypothetical protein n=1 Tax=Streptomyces sp. NPDC090306 TaxID=3365961 RepID=UPI00381C4ED8
MIRIPVTETVRYEVELNDTQVRELLADTLSDPDLVVDYLDTDRDFTGVTDREVGEVEFVEPPAPAPPADLIAVPASVATDILDAFDQQLADEVAKHFTCTEAEAVADLLRALGADTAATNWIDAHTDDECRHETRDEPGEDAMRWTPAVDTTTSMGLAP